MKKVFLLILILSLVLSSCVVNEKLTFTGDNTGMSTTDITIDDFFISVLNDLSSISDKDGEEIMDDAMINFADIVDASSYSSKMSLLKMKDEMRYLISFDYSSLDSLIKDLNGGKSNTLLKLSGKTLTFNLDINNYGELKSVIPFLNDRNFEVYGPEYSNGMSEDEYMEMITFLLSEESGESLSKSFVSIVISLPGKVKSVIGAEKTGEKEITFTFPVIDFLLLNSPLSFSVEWA